MCRKSMAVNTPCSAHGQPFTLMSSMGTCCRSCNNRTVHQYSPQYSMLCNWTPHLPAASRPDHSHSAHGILCSSCPGLLGFCYLFVGFHCTKHIYAYVHAHHIYSSDGHLPIPALVRVLLAAVLVAIFAVAFPVIMMGQPAPAVDERRRGRSGRLHTKQWGVLTQYRSGTSFDQTAGLGLRRALKLFT